MGKEKKKTGGNTKKAVRRILPRQGFLQRKEETKKETKLGIREHVFRHPAVGCLIGRHVFVRRFTHTMVFFENQICCIMFVCLTINYFFSN